MLPCYPLHPLRRIVSCQVGFVNGTPSGSQSKIRARKLLWKSGSSTAMHLVKGQALPRILWSMIQIPVNTSPWLPCFEAFHFVTLGDHEGSKIKRVFLERMEAPLPLLRPPPKCDFIHPRQLRPFPECLVLPISNKVIRLRRIGLHRNWFNSWVKLREHEIFVQHILNVKKSRAEFREASEKKHDSSSHMNSSSKRFAIRSMLCKEDSASTTGTLNPVGVKKMRSNNKLQEGEVPYSVLSTNQQHFSKRKALPRSLVSLSVPSWFLRKFDLVAGDFNGTAWWYRGKDNISTVDEEFMDSILPTPPGFPPLWWPGSILGLRISQTTWLSTFLESEQTWCIFHPAEIPWSASHRSKLPSRTSLHLDIVGWSNNVVQAKCVRTTHFFERRTGGKMALAGIPNDVSVKSWATTRSHHTCALICTWHSLLDILRPIALWDLRFLHHRVTWLSVWCLLRLSSSSFSWLVFIPMFMYHRMSHCTVRKMSHVPRKPSNLGNMSVHELFRKVQRWLINEKATPTSLCRKEFDTDSFRYNYVLKSETNADNGVRNGVNTGAIVIGENVVDIRNNGKILNSGETGNKKNGKMNNSGRRDE